MAESGRQSEIRQRCVYCQKPADGTLRDHYGELVLRANTLVICADCHEEFQYEDGPWNEIR